MPFFHNTFDYKHILVELELLNCECIVCLTTVEPLHPISQDPPKLPEQPRAGKGKLVHRDPDIFVALFTPWGPEWDSGPRSKIIIHIFETTL